MDSNTFVIWLKGFIDASHHHNLTPEGWQTLKDTLNKVTLCEQRSNLKYTVTDTGSSRVSNSSDKKQILHD